MGIKDPMEFNLNISICQKFCQMTAFCQLHSITMIPFLLAVNMPNWETSLDHRMFYYQDSPCYAKMLAPISTNTQSGDWTTNDLNSLVNEVSTKFSIDPSSVSKFFNTARFANQARRAFTTYGFEGGDYHDRNTMLRTTILKVSKNNGIYSVTGRQACALALAKIIPRSTMGQYCQDIFISASQYRVPFTGIAIQMYYNKLESLIDDQIKSFMQI